MTQTYNSRKNTNVLSSEVQKILSAKGFSCLFNWTDYRHYKKSANNAFNKPQAIAEQFIADNSQTPSDYNGYIF